MSWNTYYYYRSLVMQPEQIFILVADDDEDDRYFLRQAIERIVKDVFIFEAKNGDEAIAYLVSRTIHLIILDMNMPGLNGLEILTSIRRHTQLCHTPTIMLSTSDQPSLVAEAYAKGINCYIRKPVRVGDYDQIANALKTCFFAP